MIPSVEIPEKLEGAHELVRATAQTLEGDRGTWYDGRIWSWPPTAGTFYLRVAPQHVEFVLRALQGLVEASEMRGLEVAPVDGSRLNRVGVGIGSPGNLAAVEVIELRELAPASEEDVKQWRWVNEHRLPDEDPVTQQNIPRGNGKLRVVLPRRHDWPHHLGPGWRRSFTALAGDPFRVVLADVLGALDARAKAGA